MFGATCDGRVVIADTAFRFHSGPPCWANTTYDSFVARARMFACGYTLRWIGEDDAGAGAPSRRYNVSARGRAASIDRVKDNAFHLEDDYGVAHAHEVFHARGIPVGEANTSVARSAANCLGIIRAVNTDSGFVQAHP